MRPFFFVLLALYVIISVYVWLRMKRFFPRPWPRRVFTAAHVLLVLAFPFSQWISHTGAPEWAHVLARGGQYAMPYWLYLFLAVAACDVLVGAGRLLKIVSKDALQGRCFRLACPVLLFVLPLAVVIAGVVHCRNLVVHEYHIQVPRKSSTLTRLKIAVAADFHLSEPSGRPFMVSFVEKINALEPDVVLMPGDILEGDRDDEATAGLEEQFRRIRAKYGVFVSFGNHEAHGGHGKSGFFNRAGLTVLRDEAVRIDDAFYVAGRDDKRFKSRKPIEEITGPLAQDLPVIVLDHRPLDFERVSRSGVDIQVSGHTHHGQLFPLNFVTAYLYDLSWGHKKVGSTHFFVTSGAHVWGPPVRTSGDCEIMVIDVEFVGPRAGKPGSS
jgi:predicted MPP superfamily phosphohydrolase